MSIRDLISTQKKQICKEIKKNRKIISDSIVLFKGAENLKNTFFDRISITSDALQNPIIVGTVASVENSTITLSIDNYFALQTYIASVDFGSVINNGDGTFDVTLPDFSISNTVIFSVQTTRQYYISSGISTYSITVTNTVLTTPILSGATAVIESTTTTIVIDNYDVTYTYVASVDYGSVINNGDGTFDVTLPSLATSSNINVSVYATKAGDIDSAIAVHTITVVSNVPIADNPITNSNLTILDFSNDGFVDL